MHIQVPWKMRRRDGPHGSPVTDSRRTRSNFRDDLRTHKRPALPKEEDLDHLGKLHEAHH